MIQVETINLTGIKAEKTSLPSKIFGVKINPILMAQAVKIYLSNQRTARAHAKTRSEVDRTTAKWFRQKGTGRARHGSRSAPIFVGGGKAHGPTGTQNYHQDLPKKMAKNALFSALSVKAKDQQIIVLVGFDKAKKTQELAKIVAHLLKTKKDKLLLVLPQKAPVSSRVANNIQNLDLTNSCSLNPYAVLRANNILITKEAIVDMEAQWTA